MGYSVYKCDECEKLIRWRCLFGSQEVKAQQFQGMAKVRLWQSFNTKRRNMNSWTSRRRRRMGINQWVLELPKENNHLHVIYFSYPTRAQK